MSANTLSMLRRFRLFDTLDDTVLGEIFTQFEPVTLEAGEVLFHRNEPSECLYLLATGRLEASLTTASQEKKIINTIAPGEAVGEMGVLLDRPRSLTISALAHSTLLKLSKNAFKDIISQHPSLVVGFLPEQISRSANLIEHLSGEKKQRHIALLCADSHIDIHLFCQRLKIGMQKAQDFLLVTEEDYASQTESMDALKDRKNVVYILRSTDTPLAKKYLSEVDTVYLIAPLHSAPQIEENTFRAITKIRDTKRLKMHLILLQEDAESITPGQVSEWLKKMPFHMHHFVRQGNERDYARLIRFIRGKPIGLVLSGGGARGWAHVGVIKAMLQLDIPIDMIGGTSVGSLVSAYYAEHENYDDLLVNLKTITHVAFNTLRTRNLLWPNAGIYTRNQYILALKRQFGDKTMEDLRLPAFFISSNLTECCEVIHRTGPLWEQISCSTAMPGVFPAICVNGNLHYDGGLLNNIPTDVMRNIIGEDSTIIAVNLDPDTVNKKTYKIPSMVYFYQTLIARFFPRRSDIDCPPLIDTFMQALMLGSTFKSRQNALAADIAIAPRLEKYRLFSIPDDELDELVALGYQAALEKLGTLTVNESQGVSSFEDDTP